MDFWPEDNYELLQCQSLLFHNFTGHLSCNGMRSASNQSAWVFVIVLTHKFDDTVTKKTETYYKWWIICECELNQNIKTTVEPNPASFRKTTFQC